MCNYPLVIVGVMLQYFSPVVAEPAFKQKPCGLGEECVHAPDDVPLHAVPLHECHHYYACRVIGLHATHPHTSCIFV